MLRHYDVRIKYREQKQPTIKKLGEELASFQEMTRRKIFDDWKCWAPFEDGMGDMGDASSWLGHAITVCF